MVVEQGQKKNVWLEVPGNHDRFDVSIRTDSVINSFMKKNLFKVGPKSLNNNLQNLEKGTKNGEKK